MADLQNLIHRLQEGNWARAIRVGVFFVACLFLGILFIFDPFYKGYFKGLTHQKGMEQAAIAKQIISGNGFATPMIRPLAIAQLQANEKEIPSGPLPDTYHAPVWPTTLAPAMGLIKSKWKIAQDQYIYLGDKVVVAISLLFFYMGVWINYYTIRRLFDSKLAFMVTAFTLLAGTYWQYLTSGLPQLELFFLFSITTYTLVRAVQEEVQEDGSPSPLKWLVAAAACFGVLALTHPLTITIFLGALAFSVLYFRGRLRTGLVMGGIFLLFVTPWFIRNYQVSGNPFGIGVYSLYSHAYGGEASLMRRGSMEHLNFPLTGLRTKLQLSVGTQISQVVNYLGGSIPACLFFLSFLHLFRRPDVRALQRLLICMWVGGVIGMAFVSSDDGHSPVQANNINLLFIPLFAAYGLAFLLVQWGRLEITSRMARQAFLSAIFLLSAIPLFNILTATSRGVLVWPPYIPPYIGIVEQWTEPESIIASDMPWAIGWYANRQSLLLPQTMKAFIEMNDYETLKKPFSGVYLSPVSGNQPLWSNIIKGEYEEWRALILRSPNIPNFPFTEIVPLPIEGMNAFFTDKVRAEAIRNRK